MIKPIKYLLILLLIGTSSSLFAQTDQDAITSYFSEYLEDDRFTTIYITPRMFELFGGMDLNMEDRSEKAIADMAEDIKSLRIMIAEEDAESIAEKFSSKIDKSEYELLMQVNDQGESTIDFLIKETEDTISELLLMIISEEEFVFMSFLGNIDLNKVSKLSESFEN